MNQVWNVDRAAWCESNSYPDFGKDGPVPDWGNNSFTQFGKPPIENHNGSTFFIYAQRNWWGSPTCPSFTTPVVCNPPLTQNPFGRLQIDNVELPGKFMLHQNYPNPFNSTTIIKFDLPRSCIVTVKVYNILGQEVVRLMDGYLEAGYHSVVWDGKNSQGRAISSGVYIYNIFTDEFRESKKMTILK